MYGITQLPKQGSPTLVKGKSSSNYTLGANMEQWRGVAGGSATPAMLVRKSGDLEGSSRNKQGSSLSEQATIYRKGVGFL